MCSFPKCTQDSQSQKEQTVGLIDVQSLPGKNKELFAPWTIYTRISTPTYFKENKDRINVSVYFY